MGNLFRATFDDIERNVPIVVINGWVFRLDKGEKHFPERFTDHLPMKIVPENAIVLDIQADMLLDAMEKAVFLTDPEDDWRNKERMQTFEEVRTQLTPAIEEPWKFATEIEAFCTHRTEFQKRPSRFVRWTETKSEEKPWIAGDGTKHAWADLRHARLVTA